tara:strand:+ start:10312 stop:11565 length:1254 start_codon:yes stop_codon:yes gene_type:complete
LQKLKIGLLSYRSARFGGGQGVYVKDISSALLSMGHSIDVISGPPYPNLDKKIKLIKLPGLNLFETFSLKDRFKKLANKKNKNFNDYYEFVSAFFGGFPEPKTFGIRAKDFLSNNNTYDVIIDNQSLSYGMLEIQKKIPLIEIVHHPITVDYKYELDTSSSFKYRLSRHRWYSFLKMQKKVAPKLNKIIVPSVSSKRGVMKEFNVSEKKITVINNGLNTNEFSPINGVIRNPNRIITTASADVPLKGLDFSLKALKGLKKEYPKMHLIVIGKIKENGHTERLIKKLKLQESVFFESGISKDDIKKLYATSSISIVSSLYEGFGYPVIEAMSCGVPLVATNVASIPELTGNYATLIEPKNPKMLSNAIRDILNNYDYHINMAIEGRKHIIKTFNWTKITKQYEDIIYKSIEDFNNANF